MINAVVQNNDGKTAVIDLSAHCHEMYESLRSIGCNVSLEHLKLCDEEGEEYSVKLYSDSEIGNKAILLLTEQDSLYDAYMLDTALTNAREEIKDELEQNLLYGQYADMDELLDDINTMKIQAADTKLTFYCPLTASLDNREGDYYPVSHDVILENRDGIEEKLKEEQTPQSLTDEKLEVVEVPDQTTLFTNGRVTEQELPEGLYKHSLWEGENIYFTVRPYGCAGIAC